MAKSTKALMLRETRASTQPLFFSRPKSSAEAVKCLFYGEVKPGGAHMRPFAHENHEPMAAKKPTHPPSPAHSAQQYLAEAGAAQ